MRNKDEIEAEMLRLLDNMTDDEKEYTYSKIRTDEMTDFVAIVMSAAESLAEVIEIGNMNISTDEKIRRMIKRHE